MCAVQLQESETDWIQAYDIMKRGLGMDDFEMSDVFDQWNKGVLDSFLIEITRDVLKYKDEDGTALVELSLPVVSARSNQSGHGPLRFWMDPNHISAATRRSSSITSSRRCMRPRSFRMPKDSC